jgi:hypothetical protein
MNSFFVDFHDLLLQSKMDSKSLRRRHLWTRVVCVYLACSVRDGVKYCIRLDVRMSLTLITTVIRSPCRLVSKMTLILPPQLPSSPLSIYLSCQGFLYNAPRYCLASISVYYYVHFNNLHVHVYVYYTVTRIIIHYTCIQGGFFKHARLFFMLKLCMVLNFDLCSVYTL